jgi:hypothetical protein
VYATNIRSNKSVLGLRSAIRCCQLDDTESKHFTRINGAPADYTNADGRTYKCTDLNANIKSNL